MSIPEQRRREASSSLEQSAVRPEQEMRAHVLGVIQDTPSQAFWPLSLSYAQFGLYPTETQVQQTFCTGIASAKRSDSWKSSLTGIDMGYYKGEASFYTNLLHEATHHSLALLNRSPDHYEANPVPEEIFCWRTSQELTSVLGLHYADQEAALHLQIFIERHKQANSKAPRGLDRFRDEEQRIVGISEHERATVIWSPEGVPLIVREV